MLFYFPFPISLSIGTCTSFLTSSTGTPVNRYIATDQKTVGGWRALRPPYIQRHSHKTWVSLSTCIGRRLELGLGGGSAAIHVTCMYIHNTRHIACRHGYEAMRRVPTMSTACINSISFRLLNLSTHHHLQRVVTFHPKFKALFVVTNGCRGIGGWGMKCKSWVVNRVNSLFPVRQNTITRGIICNLFVLDMSIYSLWS